jgi:hypothetical protein
MSSMKQMIETSLNRNYMRAYLILLSLIFSLSTPSFASGHNGPDPRTELQKEVIKLFEKHRGDLADIKPQEITIGFMINAKNELVIVDVEGDSVAACDYVKKVLNFKRVNYRQEKQLTSYSLKIQLVNDNH